MIKIDKNKNQNQKSTR